MLWFVAKGDKHIKPGVKAEGRTLGLRNSPHLVAEGDEQRAD